MTDKGMGMVTRANGRMTATVTEGQKAMAVAIEGSQASKFWNFIDNGDTAELQLFGTISSEESWWDGDCVTYRDFINELNGLGEKKSINVTIQSGGGDVFAANAIYTALMTNKAAITGTVIGICASAATIVLMACDSRKIAKNAILMVHNPSVSLFGSYRADELVKMAEVTEQVKKSILTAYMNRLDKTEDEISQMMDEESWYVGQEAVDAGFCDGVIDATFQDDATDRFFIGGALHTFKDYLEATVPEAVRRKAQSIAPPSTRREAKAFSDVIDGTRERKGGMDERDMAITDAAGLRVAYPQLCAQIEAEAVDAERERLKAIDEIAAGIPQETLTRAKYEEPVSAADLALAHMKANNAAGQRFLAGMEADMRNSGASAIQADPNAGVDNASNRRMESEKKVGGLVNKLKSDRRRG